ASTHAERPFHKGSAMKAFIASLGLISSVLAGSAGAQPYPPNDAGVTMGHWHLNSRDVAANKKLFLALGGTEVQGSEFNIVKFPGVNVYMNQRPGAAPATGGTAGTVVNHVGFLVPNVQESLVKWKDAGVTPDPSTNGRKDQAYITTADGLRIEILEDKNQTIPIRHHHVHYYVPEAAIPEIQAWYAKIFGAKPGMRGNNQAADVPGANLTFTKTDMPTVTTKGRVLDHIGFDVSNMDEFLKKLEAAGVKLNVAPTRNPNSGVTLAFITDPWGTYIELNQRPNQVYFGSM